MREQIIETLKRESSILDPGDAEALADVLVSDWPQLEAAQDMLDALRNIREWSARTGGWESAAFEKVGRAIMRAEGMTPIFETEDEDREDNTTPAWHDCEESDRLDRAGRNS